jgi:hypothetical protein
MAGEIEQFRLDVLRPAVKLLQRSNENRTQTRDHISQLVENARTETPVAGRNSNYVSIEIEIEHAKTRLAEREERCKTAAQGLQQANAKFDELTAASLKA